MASTGPVRRSCCGCALDAPSSLEVKMTNHEPLLVDALSRCVASAPASVERCTELWRELVSGRSEIVQASVAPARTVLILRTRAVPVRPLGERARDVLERTFLSERRKVTASDMNVSVSMLALVLKASLVSMGLDCKPSRVSACLVMLVHGARGANAPSGTFIGDCDHEGQRLTIVTHVFDDSILRGLSPSQRAVMLMVASGKSCAHIAARRNRSGRTVINQIASASRRLGISGRFELLRCFAIGAGPLRRSRASLRAATHPLVSITPEVEVVGAPAMCG